MWPAAKSLLGIVAQPVINRAKGEFLGQAMRSAVSSASLASKQKAAELAKGSEGAAPPVPTIAINGLSGMVKSLFSWWYPTLPLQNAAVLPCHSAGELDKLDEPNDTFAKVYSKDPFAKIEIDSIADEIANKIGGSVAKAPIKSKIRSMEKIMKEYSGDAAQIKDLARNTIIVSPENIEAVVAELRSRGAAVKNLDGATNVLGYSGVNSVLETQSGILAEIQVNSPAMIYAKEPELLARVLLGNKVYSEIAARSGIPGGQGHIYYEQWRVLAPHSLEAASVAAKSREYYGKIRSANGH